MYLPLPHDLTIKKSKVHGLGLFAAEDISSGTVLGISHYWIEGKLVRTPLGGFYNHSDTPNCYSKFVFPERKGMRACLVTLRDIKAGKELTTFYIIKPLS